MDTEEQAQAYAAADFESAHAMYPRLFARKFPRRALRARVLDLGCGPCDVTLRFAQANPGYTFHAVDGSAAMLRQAKQAIARTARNGALGMLASRRRIKLIEGFIPGAPIPERSYDVIISSSFLHHLHDPQGLWQTIRERANNGTIVFVPDLRRPPTRAKAREFVRKYAGSDAKVLQQDFYNSLLAAFTLSEIRQQLKQAGLGGLKVEIISNRHLLVHGRLELA
jgi:SAM-dependent methyltransferase